MHACVGFFILLFRLGIIFIWENEWKVIQTRI